MELVIRNVKDIDADKLPALERLIGQRFHANQQLLIQIIDLDSESSTQARNEALAKAAEIARQARASAAAQGATEEEIDAAIEEAIRNVRGH